MRTVFAVVIAVVAVCAAQAQPVDGKKTELSISGSYQSSSFESGSTTSSGSSALYIMPRIGFFVSEGFELEPEVSAVFSSGGASYILNGNLAYNFIVRKKDRFFLLAGYGYANAIPLFNGIPVGYSGTDISFGVLNLGGGLKVMVADNVAMRIEYRHQRFTGTQRGILYGSGTVVPSLDVSYILNCVQFGFSIFV